MFARRAVVPFFFPLLLMACAHTEVYVNDVAAQHKWLPFLEDGKTTREEIKSKLHNPGMEYENGRIWTYRMKLEERERIVVAETRPMGQYSLVLVFDERNVLKRHSLVRYRE